MKQDTKRTLSNTDISLFCEQIAVMLSSGMSLVEGIQILMDEAETNQESELLHTINQQLDMGCSFYDALKETEIFPDFMLHMIQLGEETGTIDEVMQTLSRHYENEEAVRRSIRDALLYPFIISVMTLVVIMVVVIQVLPIFEKLYQQLGWELTGFSGILLRAGLLLRHFSAGMVILLLIIIVAVVCLTCSKAMEPLRTKLAGRLPLLRDLYEDAAAMRFAGAMALVFRSGLDAERGLELAESLYEDSGLCGKIKRCRELLEQAEDFGKAVFMAGIFKGVYARMLTVGARSGSVDTVLIRIQELYRESIDARTENRISGVEPTMVAVMSLIIGVILLSVVLPMAGVLSAF